MKKLGKRTLALLIAVLLCVSMMPMQAMAYNSQHKTGHYLKVNVQKVYKTASGSYKQYQGSDVAYIYCTDGTNHSGYVHNVNLSDFWPSNFGWSTGADWLGWAKGNFWPNSYSDKWYQWQSPTTTLNASGTAS